MTRKGVFFSNKAQRDIFYIPRDAGGRQHGTHISPDMIYNSSSCHFNQNVWYLIFKHSLQSKFYNILASGESVLNAIEASKRVLLKSVDFIPSKLLTSLQPRTKDNVTFWVSYIDAQNNSLVWHAFPECELQPCPVIEKRFSLDRSSGNKIQTADPGLFSCKLRLRDSELYSNLNNATVTFNVTKGPKYIFKIPATSIAVKTHESLVTAEIDLQTEHKWTIEGPILNSRILFGLWRTDLNLLNTGSLSLSARYELAQSVQLEEQLSSTAQYIFVHMNSVLVLEHKQLTLFERNSEYSPVILQKKGCVNLSFTYLQAQHRIINALDMRLLVFFGLRKKDSQEDEFALDVFLVDLDTFEIKAQPGSFVSGVVILKRFPWKIAEIKIEQQKIRVFAFSSRGEYAFQVITG